MSNHYLVLQCDSCHGVWAEDTEPGSLCCCGGTVKISLMEPHRSEFAEANRRTLALLNELTAADRPWPPGTLP